MQEEDPLRTFNKQIEEDRRIVISRSNINELHKVWRQIGFCLRILYFVIVIDVQLLDSINQFEAWMLCVAVSLCNGNQF